MHFISQAHVPCMRRSYHTFSALIQQRVTCGDRIAFLIGFISDLVGSRRKLYDPPIMLPAHSSISKACFPELENIRMSSRSLRDNMANAKTLCLLSVPGVGLRLQIHKAYHPYLSLQLSPHCLIQTRGSIEDLDRTSTRSRSTLLHSVLTPTVLLVLVGCCLRNCETFPATSL